MDKSLSAQWTRIRGRLRAEYGEAAYRSWLKPLTLCGYSDSRVKLSAPTRFMRDWVDSQYGQRLARLWKAEIEEIDGVDIILSHVGLLHCFFYDRIYFLNMRPGGNFGNDAAIFFMQLGL